MYKPIFIIKRLLLTLLTVLIIYGCSASTGSRYDKVDKNNPSNESDENKDESIKPIIDEDFDITPYKTKIIVPEKKNKPIFKNQNIWFDYGSPDIETKTKSLVGTADGFRVLVLTTDNIEEANQVKADIYFSQTIYEVYIDFEPPFYKVKAGDFESQKTADDLRFKLNQLGHKEAKVVKDKINIYK